jgi:hypothetical protein
MHNFNHEDLVQFLYNETSPETTKAIQTALDNDWELNEEYQQLLSTKAELDLLKGQSPRQQTIDFILQYAEQATVA